MDRVSAVHTPRFVAAEVEDGLPCLDPSVFQGRLKNSESLRNLKVVLGHLSESRQSGLSELIAACPCLFGATPTQTHLMAHDIDVADTQPVRQRFYRVNPEKRKFLDTEMKYTLDNGIAELSSSGWA